MGLKKLLSLSEPTRCNLFERITVVKSLRSQNLSTLMVLRDVKYLNDHDQAQCAAYRASADGMASPLPEEPELVCGILLQFDASKTQMSNNWVSS